MYEAIDIESKVYWLLKIFKNRIHVYHCKRKSVEKFY